MRQMMKLYFGIMVGNAVLAPIGFMGPGPDWPGIAAGALAFGAFIVLLMLARIDDRARKHFIRILGRFRLSAHRHPDLNEEIDRLEEDVMNKRPLTKIAHAVGVLHGQLVERECLSADAVDVPEITL